MNQSETINLTTVFIGQSRHTLDGSHRIMMPANWRFKGSQKQFYIILAKDHLVVCPPEAFKAFMVKLDHKTADKTQVPEMERELNKVVRPVKLDRFSRLPLPSEFIAAVGIGKQADMIGRNSKFEIWSPEKLNQPSPARDAARATIEKEVELI